MDFWTSNAFDGSRHEWTHVAPAYVQLSFASILDLGRATPWVGEGLRDRDSIHNINSNNSSSSTAFRWSATQTLYEPMLNTTMAGGTSAEVSTTAVFAPEINLMTIRIKSAATTTLSLRLSTQLPSACSARTSCMADLPMEFGSTAEADGGAALTVQRAANHWVHNEAVLVECDQHLIPTMGQRAFALTSNGSVVLRNSTGTDPAAGSGGTRGNVATECLAMLPAEGQHSNARYGDRCWS
jgi:hypothetical protein